MPSLYLTPHRTSVATGELWRGGEVTLSRPCPLSFAFENKTAETQNSCSLTGGPCKHVGFIISPRQLEEDLGIPIPKLANVVTEVN